MARGHMHGMPLALISLKRRDSAAFAPRSLTQRCWLSFSLCSDRLLRCTFQQGGLRLHPARQLGHYSAISLSNTSILGDQDSTRAVPPPISGSKHACAVCNYHQMPGGNWGELGIVSDRSVEDMPLLGLFFPRTSCLTTLATRVPTNIGAL